jgi:4-aminobutyrate--pyruvate transaminase
MMTMAKALSSSYLPISALMMTDKIYQAISDGSTKNGAFAHGVTYAAHPVCAAVALETLAIYQERNIVDHVKKVSPRLQNGLGALQNHPLVGEARGVGLVGAVELTRNKKDKVAFDAKSGMGAYVQTRAAHHGVIVRNMRDAIAVCPPLIINEAEIEELLQGLQRALDDGIDHARKQGWV